MMPQRRSEKGKSKKVKGKRKAATNFLLNAFALTFTFYLFTFTFL
jgi:hypothetical protein